ncbi:1-aminocyclopropane-1-carboxylate deaminase/D-cysteine desulfhydrase [Flavobacterium subsaxonicum]|uniref:1-aminocyclopropane-1-carboxylate deaminase n=1 Tax=Flavobacterium subsaxonicum WB 4.1-42 = DSM 21790 TaxID=1121898 RepID=A0A0A2MPS8_9FLAO|nr:pyridoxal-phosphate dependent enzyme [Flavobacterium subsaxonicum]KGO94334.1 1-aminocyclopropane-1-carboxylate deaminase [Flavobacterium subsaxonicum WB 4.1-42 = DSM 21790]
MNHVIPLKFNNNITLTVKREDLLHPHISGNKFRKLKYNILQAKAEGKTALLTFGGAFSNHIAATAAAGKEYNFATIGIIRGEELAHKIADNPTLTFAQQCGMQLHFITREAYKNKTEPDFIANLIQQFGDFYLLPEGGTNDLAVKGCEEILDANDANFTHVCCAVGTGGTIAGIINSAAEGQKVLGFPALKGAGLLNDICKFAPKGNWELVEDYHFGGYGKVTEELILFINDFYVKTGILLDPVYTAKLFFGVIDLVNKGWFAPNSNILLIHTGGLQGIAGMNKELIRKKLPIIKS